MRYDVIFTDIDNTLLDFNAGTRTSLQTLLAQFGRTLTPELLQRFLHINDALWRRYEQGEIEKSQIFSTRFQQYLGELGIETDYLAANAQYARGLQQSAVLLPGALELLDFLHSRCRLFAVTNGVTSTQLPRLKKSGLDRYFERVFISEQMGCKKPEHAFFDQVFQAIAPIDRTRCIILGDSLSSDMQGGRNAGIATCYLGKHTDDPRCDYCIRSLPEFRNVVEN